MDYFKILVNQMPDGTLDMHWDVKCSTDMVASGIACMIDAMKQYEPNIESLVDFKLNMLVKKSDKKLR